MSQIPVCTYDQPVGYITSVYHYQSVHAVEKINSNALLNSHLGVTLTQLCDCCLTLLGATKETPKSADRIIYTIEKKEE